MSYDFNALREKVEALCQRFSSHAKQGAEDLSLQDFLRALDPVWQEMVAARAALKERLGIVYRLPLADFYTLASQLHRQSFGDAECAVCRAAVPLASTVCPFCAAVFTRQRMLFTAEASEPAASRLEPESEKLEPPARAIGKSLGDPRVRHDLGDARAPRKGGRELPRSTRALVKWMRKRELAAHLPYSLQELEKMSLGDLRTVAALCEREFGVDTAMRADKLVVWVASHQPQAPIDVGPPPVGTLPDLPQRGERE